MFQDTRIRRGGGVDGGKGEVWEGERKGMRRGGGVLNGIIRITLIIENRLTERILLRLIYT